ncbi:MAG: flagellar protein FlgN [Opitutaceae bacterium]
MTPTTTFLTDHEWQPLADVLRAELQEYGGLFNLLGSQQDRIMARRNDDVLSLNEEIEAQTNTVSELRARREAMVRELGERVQAARPDRMRDLIPHFPEVARPLAEALITDINHMVRRIRQKARQNHLLLSRAMELTEETLRMLQPENFTRTYERTGKVARGRRPAIANRYQAVG